MAEELADQPKGVAEELAGTEFVFSEEQGQLRAAVRKFCADHVDESAVRGWMASDPPFDAAVWARLGTELGVLGMAVPEAEGGAGGSLVDQAVAVEQLGAALACGPLFGTVYLAIPALVAASGVWPAWICLVSNDHSCSGVLMKNEPPSVSGGPSVRTRACRVAVTATQPGLHPEHPTAVGGLPASKPGLFAGTHDRVEL